jgi:hypothetical protein
VCEDHQRISRRTAIKVLRADLMAHPEVVRSFFTEAVATSRIRHPGIVEVFDCDVDRVVYRKSDDAPVTSLPCGRS